MTEDILAQLNRMHDANMSLPDLSNTKLDIPDRLPRHVIQQALNIRTKIQVLKRINNLETATITPPPVREVMPADVMDVTKTILKELTDFNTAYGLSDFKSTAKVVDGKTPTEVYQNLLKAETMITQLGIPETVPNEVYNNAKMIVQEIEYIRIALGETAVIEAPSKSIGKQPADDYSLAFYALKGLQGLTKKPDFNIPGGVIMPERLKRNITAVDVQQLLLYSLAELSSMKVTAGAKDKLMIPPETAGQTPSTVFDELGLVNRQIQSLQW
ncbi:hypothetical protein RYZ26_07870 [Terasakiella sp. A23]|uniref:hypothetical protein n=1 Tax=Terasakiella sp. FCG-A23 TaxID=3080561 RepID=UPI002953D830|nr:hypothetical protein [Terasakiella sp. A23]MDV7339504.1 hypothetical protein [Terasakiella sp. A23]